VRRATLLLIVAIALTAHSVNAQAPKRGPLDGLYKLTSGETAGQKSTPEALTRLGLHAGKYVSISGAQRDEGTFTLDEKKTPHTITIVGTGGSIQGKTILAIYESTKDGLTICADPSGKAFPEKFESKPDSQLVLNTYSKLNLSPRGPRNRAVNPE
jgi:uncharacterized protein (TIGR03067 family)